MSDNTTSPSESKDRSPLLNASFTGLIFGFVGSVLLFYLLGLVLGQPTMPRQAWPWALLGGITGGFLLVQGIHARRHARRAANITAIVQGICSGLAAFTIAWVWAHGHVPAEALAAFALYAGINMLLVGTALGLLARYFMRVDDIPRPRVTPPGENDTP